MITRTTRRGALRFAGAAAVAGLVLLPALARARGRVVIVGGGFGGATCARTLRRIAPEIDVTLVEQNETFVTCPYSNCVLAGLEPIEAITHRFDGLAREGVRMVRARAEAIDADARTVRLAGGESLPYDRLVLSPGIDLKWGAIDGYDEAAAGMMPHAWKAGEQTLLLRRQLESMAEGGVVVMAIPANPYRCPPGPYERASLIAHYLKRHKPRSKLLLLDGKSRFSKQALFMEAWQALYPGLIEWVPFGQAGSVTSVDPVGMTLFTEFGEHDADVANVIPPQRAAAIAVSAGLTGDGDWCRVNAARGFESLEASRVHVLGDAALAGAMPKSGFAAGSQARFCAHAIAALQAGEKPPSASFISTSYSLVAPDYGISSTEVFRIGHGGAIEEVEDAGDVSPVGASAKLRRNEAEHARRSYASMVSEIYA